MFSPLPESFDDLLKCALIFLVGFALSLFASNQLKVPKLIGFTVYLWHTLFAVLFMLYVLERGGDSLFYYRTSFDQFRGEGLGTATVVEITRVFSYNLGLSFLATSLVFNIFGAIGLLFFYAALTNQPDGVDPSIKWRALLVVFLPSVSFWSVAISKDGLAFLSVAVFSWAMLRFNQRLIAIPFAIGIMVLIRPHVAVVMGGAAIMSALFHAREYPVRAALFGLAGMISVMFLVPVVLAKLKIGGLGLQELSEFIDKRETSNIMGGSSIDITSMSLPMQIITYLFRPALFEANDLFMLATALENSIHLYLVAEFSFFTAIRVYPLRNIEKSLLVFSVVLMVLFAQTTANLGIAVRQKWMIFVALYTVMFHLAASYRGRRRPESYGGVRSYAGPPRSYSGARPQPGRPKI
jgi:hypothetical protein